MSSLQDALAAHHRPPPASSGTRRVVALVGAKGLLGDAVLHALLARMEFAQVAVAVTTELPSTEDKIRPVTTDHWRDAAPTDAVLVVSDGGTLQDPTQRVANGRDKVYLPLGPDDVLAHAQRLIEAGVQRLAVIIPVAGWAHRPAAIRGQLESDLDLALARLPLSSLLLIRPERDAASAGASAFRRLVASYLRQFRMMQPQHAPVTSAALAKWAAQRLVGVAPGVHVVELSEIAAEIERARKA
ncbi:hypothetical protein [Piscinibacterium candidicorallinum]|uniref:NAD(P)-binding domain-containing protein n=1 Tax=Piscinibacterium candidicorallinum TaxID=1793872 RepID=A0ABV7GXM9_9BURK